MGLHHLVSIEERMRFLEELGIQLNINEKLNMVDFGLE